MQIVRNADDYSIDLRILSRRGYIIRPVRDTKFLREFLCVFQFARADDFDLIFPPKILQAHRIKATDQTCSQHGDLVHIRLLARKI